MTNWKRLYTDASLMLAKYQDEVVPGLREEIEELKKNQVKVRCKDCKYYEQIPISNRAMCTKILGLTIPNAEDFCSYGERREA